MAPYVLAGGEVGYLLSAKVKQSAPGEADQEEDVKHDYENFDYGLVAGAGLEIPIATGGRVLIEARYVRGLADIGKHEEDTGDDVGDDELKAMNDAIYVMAGFRF